MALDSPLAGLPITMIGACPADPAESFTHYDAFAYWEGKRLAEIGSNLNILDIGNRKCINSMLSSQHNVTSIVLKSCGDDISKVKYVIQDVSDPLPFSASSFDVFTSAATLHLIGLGRYGDRLNPNALPSLINELDRVMKPESHLIFSAQLDDKSRLLFSNGWVFTLNFIQMLFANWELLSHHIVDQPTSKECDIVFLHFKRK